MRKEKVAQVRLLRKQENLVLGDGREVAQCRSSCIHWKTREWELCQLYVGLLDVAMSGLSRNRIAFRLVSVLDPPARGDGYFNAATLINGTIECEEVKEKTIAINSGEENLV
jgi:hypothetical protein